MRNFRKFLFVALAVLAVLILVDLFLFLNFSVKRALVFFPKSQASFLVELADTKAKRTHGLMQRRNLSEDAGMLFIFPREETRFFWMKNTLIPLDMIFINSDGEVVDIKKNFASCESASCEIYSSAVPAKYVLEVNTGLADEKDIKIGDKIILK